MFVKVSPKSIDLWDRIHIPLEILLNNFQLLIKYLFYFQVSQLRSINHASNPSIPATYVSCNKLAKRAISARSAESSRMSLGVLHLAPVFLVGHNLATAETESNNS